MVRASLQQQALEQHSNHTGIEKTCLSVHESIYWLFINDETETKDDTKLPNMS